VGGFGASPELHRPAGRLQKVREALYVLDGLLENDSILRPHEHSTDTHGFTEQL
jgi:Tn3 transposase DDE domain